MTMLRFPRALAAILLLLASAGAAKAATLQFYDTMSGANFVQWWQTKGVPACTAAAGMPIAYTSAASAEVLQRLKAASPGQGDIDLLFLAPDKIAGFLHQGVLADLAHYSALIPNLANTQPPDNAVAAGTPLKGTGAPFFRYTYALIYNAAVVKNPPRSWQELYQRRNEWKGRISYVDPRSSISGAGRFFVAAFLKAFGSDWKFDGAHEDPSWGPAWQHLAEFEKANFVKHPDSVGALMTQFATGEIVIGFGPLDFVEYSKKLGTVPSTLKTVLLQGGVPGGAGYLAIPANIPAAEKEAAARFINCALSTKVQVGMVTAMDEFPGTNVWSSIPPQVFKEIPDQKTVESTRLPDAPAAVLAHIAKVWDAKVGY